jgi:hypothetical protein
MYEHLKIEEDEYGNYSLYEMIEKHNKLVDELEKLRKEHYEDR